MCVNKKGHTHDLNGSMEDEIFFMLFVVLDAECNIFLTLNTKGHSADVHT